MEAANLVLARILIAGGVTLDREAPHVFHVDAGQEIRVKVPYRFDEVGDAREDYRIVLRTRIDAESPKEGRLDGRDHRVRSDSRRGVVATQHIVLAAGTHTLSFEIDVDVERTSWQGGESLKDSASLHDQFTLQVR